jgi:hypothetical protein
MASTENGADSFTHVLGRAPRGNFLRKILREGIGTVFEPPDTLFRIHVDAAPH